MYPSRLKNRVMWNRDVSLPIEKPSNVEQGCIPPDCNSLNVFGIFTVYFFATILYNTSAATGSHCFR
jgi:hypothetical protein